MASVRNHRDPAFRPDLRPQFLKVSVEFIVNDMILTLIDSRDIFLPGIVRHPSFVKPVFLVTVKIRHLLPVAREMNIHHIASPRCFRQPSECRYDPFPRGTLIGDSLNALPFHSLPQQKLPHNPDIIVPVHERPLRLRRILPYPDQQGTPLPRRHRDGGQQHQEYAECNS